MLDHRLAALFGEEPAEAVRIAGAVGERRGGPPGLESGGLHEGARLERTLPRGEVADREVQRAVRHAIEARRDPGLVDAYAVLVELVARRSVRNEITLADHARRGHPERPKQPFGLELAPVLAGEPAREQPEDHVAAVRVAPARAGLEVERQCLQHRERLLVGVVPAVVEFVRVVLEARGVSEQLPDGDAPPVRRCAREVLRQRVVEAEPAVLGEQQDAGGGELLADGAGLEDRAGRDRHAVLEVRLAVALFLDDPSVAHDQQRESRDVPGGHLRLDVVVDDVGAERLCPEHRAEHRRHEAGNVSHQAGLACSKRSDG